jgi:PAS domain S-box-containing protein
MTNTTGTQPDFGEISFRWLLENAPDCIVIVDAQGRIMLANGQTQKLFEWTEDELIGHPIETLIPARFHEIHVQHRADFMAAPRVRPMGIGLELYGQRKDGAEFPVEISLSPIQTDKGLLVMAIVRDITELKREHYISATLQKALLSRVPERVDGLSMACSYHSAYTGAQIGGDFFDVLTLAPGLAGVVIGDVSGKGIEAAVRTALGKYTLRACAYEDHAPGSVVERLNTVISDQIGADAFITLFYGLIDTTEGSLSYANAGHMPPLYLARASDEAQELEGGDLPLGVAPGTKYAQHKLEFAQGDRLLLYTDGVTDARGDEGFFGVENLNQFFAANRREQPREFLSHLTQTLQDWSGEHLQDDVAMLLLAWE